MLAALLAVAIAPAQAQPLNRITFEEGEEGWMMLFHGRDLDGWVPVGKADWSVRGGEIMVSEGERSLLLTDEDYSDFELKVDFLADPGTNSGIFFRVPVATALVGPAYELNIAPPSEAFPSGSLLRVTVTDGAAEVAASVRYADAGESEDWRTLHLKAIGGRFEVFLDGEPVATLEDSDPLPAGRIGLQHNRGPVAFRNVKVRRLAW